MYRRRKSKIKSVIITVILIVAALLGFQANSLDDLFQQVYHSVIHELQLQVASTKTPLKLTEEIPPFGDSAYYVLHNNVPYFLGDDTMTVSTVSYEYYGDLDALGRVTWAEAIVGKDLMPTAKREDISSVKPTGWRNKPYDFIDGTYLYNRCHMIGFQLTGENANEKNLVTGTRFLNTIGMLPFENQIANYVIQSGNHVMYRVTPIFEDRNLLCSGIVMEAYSVEDNGEGVQFCIYAYNVQPNVGIDYKTGDNWLIE